jgi:hypothetical protein
MELFRLICLLASGEPIKSGVTDSLIAVSTGAGKPRKSADHVLFRIFAPRDQRDDQTQNADSRHHSEDGWHAKFAL